MDKILISVLVPDLETLRQGGGPVIHTLQQGGGVSQTFVRPFGPQFSLKKVGARAEPPGPLPQIHQRISGKFLLVGSVILKNFACGTRNPRNIFLWNLGSGIPLAIGTRNKRDLKSNSWNLESRWQGPNICLEGIRSQNVIWNKQSFLLTLVAGIPLTVSILATGIVCTFYTALVC